MRRARAMTFRKREKKSQDSRDVTRRANVLRLVPRIFPPLFKREELARFPPSREATGIPSPRRSRSSTVVRVRQPVSSGLTFRRLSRHLHRSRYFARAGVLFRLSWVFPAHVPSIKVIFASGALTVRTLATHRCRKLRHRRRSPIIYMHRNKLLAHLLPDVRRCL